MVIGSQSLVALRSGESELYATLKVSFEITRIWATN